MTSNQSPEKTPSEEDFDGQNKYDTTGREYTCSLCRKRYAEYRCMDITVVELTPAVCSECYQWLDENKLVGSKRTNKRHHQNKALAADGGIKKTDPTVEIKAKIHRIADEIESESIGEYTNENENNIGSIKIPNEKTKEWAEELRTVADRLSDG